ncbi:Conidiation protein 6-domain-containing protein [Apiosordaria backusii]|uniref:Conidiation protein 6-domain-containing protein n=1 Tax=Apiosordaria backusii TaxID=314023 RepID=A0AA40EGS4_9PEZI|nr:Conidiation protein 6-domain-containing protein [Apiosordaria backusii]
MADPGNRERGLRAAISNPRVSEKAKQRDREILEQEFGEQVETSPSTTHSSDTKKASTEESIPEKSSSFRASQTYGRRKTRSSSSGDLETSAPSASMSSTVDDSSIDGKDRGNVVRGLKAAITNPHVSEKAKERDRKKLQEMGEQVE